MSACYASTLEEDHCTNASTTSCRNIARVLIIKIMNTLSDCHASTLHIVFPVCLTSFIVCVFYVWCGFLYWLASFCRCLALGTVQTDQQRLGQCCLLWLICCFGWPLYSPPPPRKKRKRAAASLFTSVLRKNRPRCFALCIHASQTCGSDHCSVHCSVQCSGGANSGTPCLLSLACVVFQATMPGQVPPPMPPQEQ